jgi:hypothetical protein
MCIMAQAAMSARRRPERREVPMQDLRSRLDRYVDLGLVDRDELARARVPQRRLVMGQKVRARGRLASPPCLNAPEPVLAPGTRALRLW